MNTSYWRMRDIAAIAVYVLFSLGGCPSENPPNPEDSHGEDNTRSRPSTVGRVERISVNNAGVEANEDSWGASISADGRYVAFVSQATNLDSRDVDSCTDIYLHDRVNHTTTLVSVDSAGAKPGDCGSSDYPAIRGVRDQFIYFLSNNPALDSDATQSFDYRLYVHDRETGQTRLVDPRLTINKSSGNDYTVSPDGAFVLYSSPYGDSGFGPAGVYRLDSAGAVVPISVNLAGETVPGFLPALSADGRFVAFSSYGAEIVPNDTNNRADIFIRDMVSGVTARVSVDEDGVQLAGGAMEFGLSPNGQSVVFVDAFLRLRRFDLLTGRSSLVFTQDDTYVGPVSLAPTLYSSEIFVAADGRAALIGPALLLLNPLTNSLTALSAIGAEPADAWIQPANYGGGGFGQGIIIRRFSSTHDLSAIAFQNLGNQYVEGDTNNSVDILVWTATP